MNQNHSAVYDCDMRSQSKSDCQRNQASVLSDITYRSGGYATLKYEAALSLCTIYFDSNFLMCATFSNSTKALNGYVYVNNPLWSSTNASVSIIDVIMYVPGYSVADNSTLVNVDSAAEAGNVMEGMAIGMLSRSPRSNCKLTPARSRCLICADIVCMQKNGKWDPPTPVFAVTIMTH